MFYLGNWTDSFVDNYQWSNASSITKGLGLKEKALRDHANAGT